MSVLDGGVLEKPQTRTRENRIREHDVDVSSPRVIHTHAAYKYVFDVLMSNRRVRVRCTDRS